MDIVLLISGLICGYVIYSQGVRDGMRAVKGEEPKIPDPVKYVKAKKEAESIAEEDQELINSFNNFMSFDGTKQGGGVSG